MTAPESRPRPRALTIAVWLLIAGSVLLLAGGLLALTFGFDALRQVTPATISDAQLRQLLAFRRGAGAICVVAGLGLAYLTGKTRNGDVRFRRATIGLGLALIVLVGILQVGVNIGLVALVSLLPIIAGTLLLTRPVVASWFESGDTSRSDD